MASSPESESLSEMMRSITRAHLIWLATLALTASKMLAMAAGAACLVLAVCGCGLYWFQVLSGCRMGSVLSAASEALSVMNSSTKCLVVDNLLEMSTRISITVFKLISVSTGWVTVLFGSLVSTLEVGE